MTRRFKDPRFRKKVEQSGGIGTIGTALKREADAFREAKEIRGKEVGREEFKSLEDRIKIVDIPHIGPIACIKNSDIILGLYQLRRDGFNNETHCITHLAGSVNLPRVINDYMQKEGLPYRA